MPFWMAKTFSQSHSVGGSRSTAITPLQWMMFILVSGILGLIRLSAPVWLLWIFGILIVLVFLLYAAMYIYFASKNPNALRSEKFELSKMAMERGLIGDSETGLSKPIRASRSTRKRLSASETIDATSNDATEEKP